MGVVAGWFDTGPNPVQKMVMNSPRWYSKRPIRDLLGLVTPAMTEDMAHGRSFERALRERPTALVLDHTARRIGNLPSRGWFRKIYEPVAVFPDAGGGEVVVFRKR